MCVSFLLIGDFMENKWMMIALNEAKKAYKHNEVPVGAVITKNNKIISKGYNQKEKKQNVLKHAEIIVIEKACKKLKNWRLNDCTIYITLEPCMMCTGAIIHSRIKKIVYATSNPNLGFLENNSHIIKQQKIDIQKSNPTSEKISSELLKNFFMKTRK